MSGRLADHYGARPFTVGGMVIAAIGLLALTVLPANFVYWEFALIIFVVTCGSRWFAVDIQNGAVRPYQVGGIPARWTFSLIRNLGRR